MTRAAGGPRSWRRYLRFWGSDIDADVELEFLFHLEAEIVRLIEAGYSRSEAERRARQSFGDIEAAARLCRRSDRRRLHRERWTERMHLARHELRLALRRVALHPGYATAVVVTLAIGIGANAAVLSIVDYAFLRLPAAVRDAGEIRRLYALRPRVGESDIRPDFTYPEWRDIRHATGAIAAAYVPPSTASLTLPEGGSAPAVVSWVDSSFATLLGLDNAISAGDTRVLAGAVISHRFWKSHLGGDPAAIGKALRIDGAMIPIQGIAPDGFTGIDLAAADVWLPLQRYIVGSQSRQEWRENRAQPIVQVILRVGSSADEQRIVRAAETEFRRGRAAYREMFPRREVVGSVGDGLIVGSVVAGRGPMQVSQELSIALALAGLALMVFVVACANVSSLCLARASQRERETAVRMTLGADRMHLVAQLVAEALVVSAIAVAVATIGAAWLGTALRRLLLPQIEFGHPPVDARVFGAMACLALAGNVAAALAPIRLTRMSDVTASLKGGSSSAAPEMTRARMIFLSVQAALCLVLVIGTGLVGRSVLQLRRVPLGYDVARVVTISARSFSSTQAAMLPDIARDARAIAGVRAARMATGSPFGTLSGASGVFDALGTPITGVRRLSYIAVDPGYLRTVGTHVTSGRSFSDDDRAGSRLVAIVNRELARQAWPGQEPLGKCLRLEQSTAPCLAVVGVAENAHTHRIVENARPVVYVSLQQPFLGPDRPPMQPSAVVVRVARDPLAVVQQLRSVVSKRTAGSAPLEVKSLSELLAPQYAPWYRGAVLFGLFAAMALVVALTGLYGILAYNVEVRSRELGVRMALGASRIRVARLILGDAMRHIAVGAVAGLMIAGLGAKLLRPLLYEVSPHDPAVLAGSVAILFLTAIVACMVPTIRAVRDTLRALLHAV
jgi:predicted permease